MQLQSDLEFADGTTQGITPGGGLGATTPGGLTITPGGDAVNGLSIQLPADTYTANPFQVLAHNLAILLRVDAGGLVRAATLAAVQLNADAIYDSGGELNWATVTVGGTAAQNALTLPLAVDLPGQSEPDPPATGTVRLFVDSADSVLKQKSDAGTVSPLSRYADPLTTRGDVLVRNASNVTARLAVGTTGKVLHSNGTDPAWQALVAADLPTATISAQGAAILATPSTDTTAGHVVQASDARLSDTRTPASASITTKAQFSSAMAAVQKAASNPGSPATGDLLWRSDVARGLTYDGTRWASDDVKFATFINDAALTATTTSGSNVGRLNQSGLYNWLPVQWAISIFVATTNNSTNYWSFDLRYITSGNTVTTIATITTNGKSPNTWDRVSGTTFSPATIPSTAYMLEIIATKAGTGAAPGSLLAVPSLTFREIVP